VGRTVKDVRLQDRAARLRLPVSSDIYWRTINEGCHLGYYKGERGGKWVTRYREAGSGKGYVKARIGEADDVRDADGDTLLDWRQAQAKAHEWFEERSRGGEVKQGPFTVGDALDEYIEGFRGRDGKIPADLNSRVEKIIRPALGHHEVGALTAKIISTWHTARSKSVAKLRTGKHATEDNSRAVEGTDAVRRRRSTANRDLTVLKAALNKAAAHREWMSTAAWDKVSPFAKVDVAKRRFLSDDEARRLVNATDPEFRLIVLATLLTGARYGELRHATVGDYDRQARTLWLYVTKGDDPRPAYLDEEGIEMLDQASAGKGSDAYLFLRNDGEQWGKSHQARRMEEAFDKAKIAKTTYHDLRRSYGARLARNKVPMAVIAEAMGHKDERITRKHYAHLAPSYVSETVRAAVAGLGVVPTGNVKRIDAAR
jgi:integrase